VALFLASLALILGASADDAVQESPAIAFALYFLLLVMNFICTRLLVRWNSVIQGHFATAQSILEKMKAGSAQENGYYYFHNRLGLRAQRDSRRAQWGGRPLTKEEQDRLEGFYISTDDFFLYFNYLGYAVIALFIGLQLVREFPALSVHISSALWVMGAAFALAAIGIAFRARLRSFVRSAREKKR